MFVQEWRVSDVHMNEEGTIDLITSDYIRIDNIQTEIDIIEEDIRQYDLSIFKLLLKDKTTGKNIMWCTNNYIENGKGFDIFDEINPKLIIGVYRKLIQPRSSKHSSVQVLRTRDRAEVFTPSWVCNKQNNLVDAKWFGYKDVFNKETEYGWVTNTSKILFPLKKNWKKYVDAQRLEIACGEAPYLVNRYDTVTGRTIQLSERIGLFDRKMRVVNENSIDDIEWLTWSVRAVESIFAYEYQGDNLLLARENLLYSYIDYYKARFNIEPERVLIRKIANIIAWNLWQMDGLKFIVPNSCNDVRTEMQISIDDYSRDDLQDDEKFKDVCPGCKFKDITKHTGIYCKIQDWRSNEPVLFINMMRGIRV